jgi:CBS domain-containing protein
MATHTGSESETLPAPAMSTVREVMRSDVIFVRPDTSLITVAELLLDHHISGVPVVDSDGRLVGVISQTDLLRRQVEEEGEAGPSLGAGLHLIDSAVAADVMTRKVLTVGQRDSVADAAKVMITAGVHRVPVVTKDDKLMGIVSTSDVVRWVAGLP